MLFFLFLFFFTPKFLTLPLNANGGYTNFLFEWNDGNESFFLNDESFPELVLLEGNTYLFRTNSHTDPKLIIGEENGSVYQGAEDILNNGVRGSSQYCYLKPASNTPRSLIYYPNGRPDLNGTLLIKPYLQTGLIFPELQEAGQSLDSAMFGYSLSLGQGGQLFVGSPSFKNGEGLISLYSQSDHNFSFELDTFIQSPFEGQQSKFGTSLSHSEGWLYSGLPDHESFRGSVSIFNPITGEGGEAVLFGTFLQSNQSQGYLYGWEIVSSEANYAVSALNAGNVEGGEVKLFGNPPNEIGLIKELKDESGGVDNLFGYDISINSEYLLVGAPGGGAVNGGTAHLFGLNDLDSSQSVLAPEEVYEGDRFGHSVALMESYLFVASPLDDTYSTDGGAVYVFEKNDTSVSLIDVIYPDNSGNDYHFGTKIFAENDHLFVLSSSKSLPPFSSVYSVVKQADANNSEIRLVNQIYLDEVAYQEGGDPFASSISVSAGTVAIGFPQAESSAGEETGVVQAFHNPSWTWGGSVEVPPVFLDENVSLLRGEEGIGTLSHSFEAIHPLHKPLNWEINSSSSGVFDFEINASSGLFLFEYPEDYNGSSSFTLKLSGDGHEVYHSFDVLIDGINDPPTFLDANFTELVGTQGLSFDYKIEVNDIDSTSISIIADGLPDGLSFDDNDFSIYGTPQLDGNATITLTANDSEDSTILVLNLIIYPGNARPTAVFNGDGNVSEINLTLFEDFSRQDWKDAINSLEIEDLDENQSILMSVIEAPAHGVLRLSEKFEGSNDINYFPYLNFNGEDSFRIRFKDDHASSSLDTIVQFNLNIESVNDLPRVDSFPATFDVNLTELFLYDFTVSDSEGDEVSIHFDWLPSWMTFDGLRTISGVPTENDYQDLEEFDLYVKFIDSKGGTLTKVSHFTLLSNSVIPSIDSVSPLPVSLNEDETFEGNITCSFAGDSSLLVWSTVELPEHGSVSLSPSADEVSFVYTPDSNYSGADRFVVMVEVPNLNQFYDTVEVVIDVLPVPDPPVFTSQFYSGIILGKPWEFSVNAFDADLDDRLALSRSFPEGHPPWWISLNKTSDRSWLLSGVPNSSNDLDLSLSLTDGNFTVDANFTLSVIDDPGDLVITHNLSTLNPVINEDEFWYIEDGIEVNNGESLGTHWSFLTEPGNGVFTFKQSVSGGLSELKYQPDTHFFGHDKVVLQASNGYTSDYLELNFTINSVPDPPILLNFPTQTLSETNEDYFIEFSVFDGDGITGLTYEFIDAPQWLEVTRDYDQGKEKFLTLEATPDVDAIGLHPVKISFGNINDNLYTEANFSIQVSYGNKPPVPQTTILSFDIEEDTPFLYSDRLIAEDNETPSNELVWMILEQPDRGKAYIDGNGSNLRFIPESNSSFTETFLIGVRDNGFQNFIPRTSAISVSVNISEEDDPLTFLTKPTTDTIGAYEWNDESAYVYEIHAFDSDWPWQGYPVLKLTTPLPSWAKWQTLGNGKALLSGIPTYDDAGLYHFKIEATSALEKIKQDFQLLIRVDDYPPIFYKDSVTNSVKSLTVTILEDMHQGEVDRLVEGLRVANIDFNQTSDSALEWTIENQPKSEASINEFDYTDGNEESEVSSFQYTPETHFSGVDSFTLKVNEGDRVSLLPIEVVIKPVPDAPYFESSDDEFEIEAGDYFEVEYKAFDPDKQKLKFHLKNLSNYPSWLTKKSEYSGIDYSSVILSGTVPNHTGVSSYSYNILAADPTGRWSAKVITLSK